MGARGFRCGECGGRVVPTTGRAVSLTVRRRDGTLTRIAFVPPFAVLRCGGCDDWYTDHAAITALDAEARRLLGD